MSFLPLKESGNIFWASKQVRLYDLVDLSISNISLDGSYIFLKESNQIFHLFFFFYFFLFNFYLIFIIFYFFIYFNLITIKVSNFLLKRERKRRERERNLI